MPNDHFPGLYLPIGHNLYPKLHCATIFWMVTKPWEADDFIAMHALWSYTKLKMHNLHRISNVNRLAMQHAGGLFSIRKKRAKNCTKLYTELTGPVQSLCFESNAPTQFVTLEWVWWQDKHCGWGASFPKRKNVTHNYTYSSTNT